MTSEERTTLKSILDSSSYIKHFCEQNNILSPLSMNKVKVDEDELFSVVYYSDTETTMSSLVCLFDSEYVLIEAYESNAVEDVLKVKNLLSNESLDLVFRPEKRIADCKTWVCHTYESGGGHADPDCERILGFAEIAVVELLKLEWFGQVVVRAGVIVACYVPKYKYCVAGSWQPICEM